MNPCTNCKRPVCPEKCYPKLDWLRGAKRRNKKRNKPEQSNPPRP